MIQPTFDIAKVFEQLFPTFYRASKLAYRTSYNQYRVVLDNNMLVEFHILHYRNIDCMHYQLTARPGGPDHV